MFLRYVYRPVLEQGAPAGLRHFTCKFWHKMALVQCWSAFARTKSATRGCPALGHRLFPCKFSLKLVLVRSHSWGADGRSISLVKKRVKIFLWHFHAHFDCAGLPKSVVLMSRHNFCPWWQNKFLLLQFWGCLVWSSTVSTTPASFTIISYRWHYLVLDPGSCICWPQVCHITTQCIVASKLTKRTFDIGYVWTYFLFPKQSHTERFLR